MTQAIAQLQPTAPAPGGSSSSSQSSIDTLQENPNAIPEGETPHAVSMFAFDSLLDVCKPGDRITVTGIYKAVPMRTSPRLRQLKVPVRLAHRTA
jgi:DNA replicative helicase MCM subunit Mcm2 (Cdc46/Mcm family)